MTAGDPASAMITGSTRSDMVQDAGVVDMGFHWQNYLDEVPELKEMLNEAMISAAQQEPAPAVEANRVQLRNHPNPFNPTTTISLTLDEAAAVKLSVYDLAGRLITTLHQGNLEAGKHDFPFSGQALPTGVYVYRADAAGRVLTGKALLLK